MACKFSIRIYIGTQFTATGEPLATSDVAHALDDFQRSIALITGGVTVYSASGISVECPTGEATTVVETFYNADQYADIVAEVALLKLWLKQGSILVVQQFAEVQFL